MNLVLVLVWSASLVVALVRSLPSSFRLSAIRRARLSAKTIRVAISKASSAFAVFVTDRHRGSQWTKSGLRETIR